ncbi:MAG: hypothetical protein LBH32_11880 [Dysgonamonadaceae bacterium]|nr:hypothetical protein [Dysgonamonadaceae bacterium]
MKKLDNSLIKKHIGYKNKIIIVCIGIMLLFVWEIIGHFFPVIHILFTYIVFACLITLFWKALKVSNLAFIPLIMFLVLMDDIIFRLTGGGIHDDAARGWCLISSLVTIVFASVLLLIKIIIEIDKKNHVISVCLKIIGYVFYILSILFIVYLAYSKIIFWI